MMSQIKPSDARALSMVAALWLALVVPCHASPNHPPLLEHGFIGLYNLDFAGAQRDFAEWQAQHPEDPMGPVSEAAGVVYSEFQRLGVLEAQFLESDRSFTDRPKVTPDLAAKEHFETALAHADNLARTRLENDPNDRDALFALTLSSGLRADYAALVEKRNFASLHYTKEASQRAQQLLAVCGDCYDALLATGFSKYVIGSLSAPTRWVLKMSGLPADKQGGIADLQKTAQQGDYLAPLARILLAIAYVREKDKLRALQVLNGLRADFPSNTLVTREIARLQATQ